MSSKQKFGAYVTRTAFSLSLSAPQIRMICALKHRHQWAYCHGPSMTITAALERKGLVSRHPDQQPWPEPNYRLTYAGELAYAMCKEGGLTAGYDMEFSPEAASA